MTGIVERYLRLGLRIGRHVDGIVDSYFGPPELAAEVEAAPPVDPEALVAEADALLDAVEDGWLRDQLGGLRATLLLHERGADDAEVRAYLARWELISPERAEHAIRFYREPTSRT
jgi:hypothetical protein